MSRKYFPLFIDLGDKRVLIFGGGQVGFRKAKQLAGKCKLSVISQEFNEEIIDLANQGKLSMIRMTIEESGEEKISNLMDGAFLVIVATDDPKLNKVIQAAASSRGILVNRVDDPDPGDVIFPAIFQKGDIKVAVVTQGKSPLMAAYLKRQMSKIIGDKEEAMVELQAYARDLLKVKIADTKKRKSILEKILNDEDVNQAIEKDDLSRAKQVVDSIMKQTSEHDI